MQRHAGRYMTIPTHITDLAASNEAAPWAKRAAQARAELIRSLQDFRDELRDDVRADSGPLTAIRRKILRDCEDSLRLEGAPPSPPSDGLRTPSEAARKPRKPTFASVAKQANKAAIPVARYEIKPDGTIVIVTGQGESTEPNPWLAEIEKATKQ